MRCLVPHLLAALALLAGNSLARADGCGEYGTSVEFFKTPSDAATQAKKDQKLVFVLHVSGNFEEPRLHLKQRRSAPCERAGQSRSRQVRQRVLRLLLPEGRHLQDRRQGQAGRQRRHLLLRPRRPRAARRRRPGRCRDHAPRGQVGGRDGQEGHRGQPRATAASSRRSSARPTPTSCAPSTAWWSSRSTFDSDPTQDPNGALTYRDPTGRPLAPEAAAAADRRPGRDHQAAGCSTASRDEGRRRPAAAAW